MKTNIDGFQSSRTLPVLSLLTVSALSILSTSVALANVVGNDAQNFNPATGDLGFVTVQSSQTLDPGYFHFGLFVNHAVNTLPYFEPTKTGEASANQSRTKWNDTVTGADINIGMGILENWDIGLSLPQILAETVNDQVDHGQFGDKGNTEIRISTKFRLWGDREQGIAVIGSTNIDRTRNNPYTGTNAGPTTNLELVGDTTWKEIAFGANVGYRFRQPGDAVKDSPITPFKNQLIASVAASYHIPDIDSKIIFEIFGSRPAETENNAINRSQSSAEALLGIKHDVNNNMAVHFGGGTELFNGMSSPDWRLYTGITWTTGPVFNKPVQPIIAKENEPIKRMAPPIPPSDPFAGAPQMRERVVIHDVLFEFGSDEMFVGNADDTLERLSKYLVKPPVYKKIVIEGHTCSIGSKVANRNLSLRRAERIRERLIQKFHLDPKKVEVVGYGSDHPIASNANYQGRQLNRRVEFKIIRE